MLRYYSAQQKTNPV